MSSESSSSDSNVLMSQFDPGPGPSCSKRTKEKIHIKATSNVCREGFSDFLDLQERMATMAKGMAGYSDVCF